MTFSGYKWCVDTAKEYMEKHPDEDQSNLMALYGISLDGLGRFLYDIGKYNEALPSKSSTFCKNETSLVIHESIRVAEQIDVDGNQIITLKINFSSVLAEAGQTTEALDVLNEMLNSSKIPPPAKINVLLNKALLYKLKMNQDSDAETTMKEAVKEALAQNDAQTLLLVKQLARDNKINLL